MPLSGEVWEMGISVCSLCTEPWGDSQLRTISFFAAFEPGSTSPIGHPRRDINECILWATDTKSRVQHMYTSFYLGETDTLGGAEGEHEDGTHQPPCHLERIVGAFQSAAVSVLCHWVDNRLRTVFPFSVVLWDPLSQGPQSIRAR